MRAFVQENNPVGLIEAVHLPEVILTPFDHI